MVRRDMKWWRDWGLGGVYVKDESKRQNLQAFKVSGAAFAMARWLCRHMGVEITQVKGLADLKQLYEARHPQQPMTFVTCTDGNHGRAVSWAAKQLGQKAVVFMPKGSAPARVQHIRDNGGTCTVTEMNYDDTVKHSFMYAEQQGGVVLQDTTAPGYTEIPTWIMQGYTALADEATEQMFALDGCRPSHVILQVGVGSFAAAILGYFVEHFRGEEPVVAMTLEPTNAACAFKSASHDGMMLSVEGDLESMMAGLCCGVLSDIAWPILREHVRGGFFSVSDGLAGNGMRLLHREGIEAGECGGAAPGLLQRLCVPDCPRAEALRTRLGLGPDSRVLLINTEGATDPVNFEQQLQLPDVGCSPDDFAFAPPIALKAGEEKL